MANLRTDDPVIARFRAALDTALGRVALMGLVRAAMLDRTRITMSRYSYGAWTIGGPA